MATLEEAKQHCLDMLVQADKHGGSSALQFASAYQILGKVLPPLSTSKSGFATPMAPTVKSMVEEGFFDIDSEGNVIAKVPATSEGPDE